MGSEAHKGSRASRYLAAGSVKMRNTAIAASVMFAMSFPVGAEEPHVDCGVTELLHTNTSIRFVGADPTNADVGDRRILHWFLEDLGGFYIGEFDVVTTVLGGTADMGHYVRVDGSINLPNGSLFVATSTLLNDASNTLNSGNPKEVIDWAIVGGTGDFAEARGMLSVVVPEERSQHLENRPMTLNIAC